MRNYKLVDQQSLSWVDFNNDPLFKAIYNDSPEAIFLLGHESFKVLDCNNKAIELFQANQKLDIINIPSFHLYGSNPVEFSRKHLIEEINKGKEHVQELSFKTFKNNIFWGRLSQKLIVIGDKKVVILRVSKVIDYAKASEILDTLIKHTSKVIGADFFKELTRLMATALETKYVLVARVQDGKKKQAETIEFWSGTAPANNFVFELDNCPCTNVLRGYITFYPKNLQELFPNYSLISTLGIESFFGAPIFNNEGNVKGMLLLMDDKPMVEKANSRYILSIFASRAGAEMERMYAEEKLKKQTDELIQANATKDKFLKVIAHDLKNPFHQIMGYSELLRKKIDKYDKKKIQDIVNIIDYSVQNSNALLENLTNWSRLQRGKINLVPENINLRETVQDISRSCEFAANKKKIHLLNDIDQNLSINSDSNMLKVIFRNLFSNAIKYSYLESEVIVRATVNKNDIVVRVEDKGVGMSAEEIDNVFKIETNIPKPGTDNETGAGFGLVLCKEFVDILNGKIWIESKIDEGTKVFFSIPV
jgi:signal transduction histidine kinase